MKKPRITWEQYLGPLKASQGFAENYAQGHANKVRKYGRLNGEYRELEDEGLTFRIGMGIYHATPQQQQLQLRVWGMLALATLPAGPGERDQIVGMINQRCLWIHPDYRGHGIGPEMCYERALWRIACLPLDTGIPCLLDWEERTARQKNPPGIRFTREGIECLKRTYILLVERGAIDNRNCEMPELGEYNG